MRSCPPASPALVFLPFLETDITTSLCILRKVLQVYMFVYLLHVHM